jgi:hypothetical protein
LYIACVIFFLMLVSVHAFSQEIKAPDTTQYITLRIDPSNANGASVSDIIEKVKFVPLETTAESLFGSIIQIEVTENEYIIYDEDTNCILIFNRDGKYRAKIKGRIGSSGHKINKFNFNRWNKQIVYSNDGDRTILYADLGGKLVKKIINENFSTGELNLTNYVFLNSTKSLHYNRYTDYKNLKDINRAMLTYANNFSRPFTKSIAYSKDDSKVDVVIAGIGPLTSFGLDTTYFFSKPYDYSIYTLTPKTQKLSYKIVLPSTVSLPADFSNPGFNGGDHVSFVDKNRHLIFCLNNCYQLNNNLFFTASKMNFYKENSLIYNLKSGTLIAYKQITPDQLSGNLPIYDPVGVVFENSGLAFCDGNFVYTSVSSLTMFSAYAKLEKPLKLDKIMEEYFTKGKKSDNPVIVELKFKNNF